GLGRLKCVAGGWSEQPIRRGGLHARGRGKVRDFLQGNRRAKLIDWLKIDSSIDSGLYNSWTRFLDWWSGYSSFFNKFEVKGFVRALNELACEGLTLGAGALLVLAAFALPAFEIAQGKMNLS